MKHDSESSVKMLWDHFRTDDPNATIQFEKFLERVSHNIHSKEQEKLTLEEFMKSQNETREEQVSTIRAHDHRWMFSSDYN